MESQEIISIGILVVTVIALGLALFLFFQMARGMPRFPHQLPWKERLHNALTYQTEALLGIRLEMSRMAQSLDKIAEHVRLSAPTPPPMTKAQAEIEIAAYEEAAKKRDQEAEKMFAEARKWMDEATIGQSTKDLL